MTRRAGQLISRGPRTWLVRVSLGRGSGAVTRTVLTTGASLRVFNASLRQVSSFALTESGQLTLSSTGRGFISLIPWNSGLTAVTPCAPQRSPQKYDPVAGNLRMWKSWGKGHNAVRFAGREILSLYLP